MQLQKTKADVGIMQLQKINADLGIMQLQKINADLKNVSLKAREFSSWFNYRIYSRKLKLKQYILEIFTTFMSYQILHY